MLVILDLPRMHSLTSNVFKLLLCLGIRLWLVSPNSLLKLLSSEVLASQSAVDNRLR